MRTFASALEKYAEIAQLVEHNLAKVRVASSSLVFRSKTKRVSRDADLLFEKSAKLQSFSGETSPDGVPSYVSRPCAQGRLFCLLQLGPAGEGFQEIVVGIIERNIYVAAMRNASN